MQLAARLVVKAAGIMGAERLIPILGANALMGGTVGISATIGRPGVITQVGTMMMMSFGELDGRPSPRGEALLALAQKAGFQVTLTNTIETSIWIKFIMLTGVAGVTALMGCEPAIHPAGLP